MAEDGIAYYKSAAPVAMTEAELEALEETAWTVSDTTVLEDESGVIYARFKDALGNTRYISSDGITVGDAAPVVEIRLDESSLLEGSTRAYLEKAELKFIIKDDSKSGGIKSATYQVNDGEVQSVTLTEGQTEAEAVVTVDTFGINTITINTEDKNGNAATICETIIIYGNPKVEVSAAENIVYDGKPLEIDTDISISTGESTGEITWSYRAKGESDYREGLPVNAGIYDVKASIARDDKNYYVAAEMAVEIEIHKASQILQFSSDCYRPVIGGRFYAIVGGVTSTGKIKVTTGNMKMLKIVEAELEYDKETQIVRVPVEVLAAGNTTITISVAADTNYRAGQKNVNVQITEAVSAEHPYIVSGIVGENGWYRSDVSIQAAAGYTVAGEEAGEYQSSYTVVGEGKNLAPATLYFKSDAGEPYAITMDTVNIDMTAPEGTLTAKESVWRQFLNTITFGTFFKDTVVVEVKDTKDTVSGVNTVEYYQSAQAMTMEEIAELNDNDWTERKITLEPDQAAVVYAKITDMAGNVTYLSTDGIIVDKTPALIEVKTSYDTGKWITATDEKAEITVKDAVAGIAENGITYQIDGGTAFAGTENFTISGLEDGVHNILITAADQAGNVVTQTVSWKQDTKAPTVELSQAATDVIGIKVTTGVSGIASVQISENGGAWEDITQTYQNGYKYVKNGTYEVRLTTNAGVTVSKTFTVKDSRASQKITAKKSKYKLVYGQKAFKLGAKSDKNAILTYKSSDTKVVKVDGKGKVTIKGCGNAEIVIRAEGTAKYQPSELKISLTVSPKQTKLSSVASKKAKTMVVKWKRDKKASGYQITFATNKKFKKAKSFTVNKNKTTKFTITKISASKTYYVKVRAFKKSGSEKIYGEYSKPKSVKVK